MQRFWQIVGRVASFGLGLSILLFYLMRPDARSDAVTWLGVGMSALCTVGIVLAGRRYLATWRGLAVLAAALAGAHVWLWRMWSLWESAVYLVRNINTVVGLLAIDLVVAILVVTVLILVFRGGAPVLLGAVWLLYPPVLIGLALMFPDLESLLEPDNLRAQVLWLTPMTVLPSVCCLGLPAFLAHLAVVAAKEIRGR